MKKKLFSFLGMLLVLVLLTGILLYTMKLKNDENCPEEGMARWDLVSEHHPDDVFFEELVALGGGIQVQGIPDQESVKDSMLRSMGHSKDILEGLAELNGEVLNTLHDKLHEERPFGRQHTEAIGNKLRLPVSIIRPIEESPLVLWELKNLKYLLIQHARLVSLDQNQEALNRDMQDISFLTDFELQNPTLVQLMVSTRTGLAWFDLIVNQLPDEQLQEDYLALIPQNAQIRKCLGQSFYLEDVLTENLLTVQVLETEWWAPLVMNPCMTRKKVGEIFAHKLKGLEGALLNYQPLPPILKGEKPGVKEILFENGLTWVLMDIGVPMFKNFVLKAGCYEAAADLARLRIWLKSGERTQASMTALITEHELLNPFTAKPYQVHEDGRIILFPEQTTNADWLRGLEPFQDWLHLP